MGTAAEALKQRAHDDRLVAGLQSILEKVENFTPLNNIQIEDSGSFELPDGEQRNIALETFTALLAKASSAFKHQRSADVGKVANVFETSQRAMVSALAAWNARGFARVFQAGIEILELRVGEGGDEQVKHLLENFSKQVDDLTRAMPETSQIFEGLAIGTDLKGGGRDEGRPCE